MKYKTLEISKAFFSERERKGMVCLGLGMRLMGVFSAANPFPWLSAFTNATTSIFWGSEAEGAGDFAT